MARGRPRKEHPTTSNVTPATILGFADELTTALRVKRSADSAVANVYKRAESAGLDRKTLKRAHTDAQKAENERLVDEQRYRRYMAALGCPVDDVANGEDAEAAEKHQNNEAFESGIAAGAAGSPITNCPFDPGTESYQSYSLGWSQGQKQAVEALGGATRRAPQLSH